MDLEVWVSGRADSVISISLRFEKVKSCDKTYPDKETLTRVNAQLW